jgi:protein TonB
MPLLLSGASAQVISPAGIVVLPPKANPRAPLRQAEYPEAAKNRKEEGIVKLDVYVLSDGTVSQVKVNQSSGFPTLDDAAMRAALEWRVFPGTVNGRPIDMWGEFSVSFKL